MTGPAARIAVLASHLSPYPPSFDGSGLLYSFALWSVLSIACIAIMVAGWMARDLWRDRHVEHPGNLITIFRFIILSAAGAAFIRCAPEAAYMLAYGEANPATIGLILMFKRAADAIAILFVLSWMTPVVIFYPSLCWQLKFMAPRPDPGSLWPQLVRPFCAVSLVGLIAMLVAFGKAAQ